MALAQVSKLIRVEETVRKLGFEVRNIDPYYLLAEDYKITDTELPTPVMKILQLAQENNISTVRHPLTNESKIDNCLLAMTGDVNGNYSDLYNPYQTKAALEDLQNSVREIFKDTDTKVRRGVYLTGGYQLGDYYL